MDKYLTEKQKSEGLNFGHRSQIKRFITKKKFLKDKIRALECKIGTFTEKGNPIPSNCFAFYITPNPRNLHKAGINVIKKSADLLSRGQGLNPYKIALNCIQTCTGTKKYFDIDTDVKNNYHIQLEGDIHNDLFKFSYEFVKTRGGGHLLINLQDPDLSKRWYQEVESFLQCLDYVQDFQMNNDLCPLPGTCQGNYIPKVSII